MADQIRAPKLDWEDLRVLLELARQGSLSATARALGVTHVTVSRRIASLEADLAQPLVVRESGRYVLTEAGKRILELASPMLESSEAILRAMSGFTSKLVGPVRVTAPEAVGGYIVMPALAVIRERHPEIDLDVRVTNATLNLARSDTDVAVRLSKPEPGSGVVGVKVGELAYHIYGERSYLAGRPSEAWEFIGYPSDASGFAETQVLDEVARGRRQTLRINHLTNRITATRLGFGLALLPAAMVEDFPELVRVSASAPLLRRELYVLIHEDMQDVPRIKACFDILVEVIGAGSVRRE